MVGGWAAGRPAGWLAAWQSGTLAARLPGRQAAAGCEMVRMAWSFFDEGEEPQSFHTKLAPRPLPTSLREPKGATRPQGLGSSLPVRNSIVMPCISPTVVGNSPVRQRAATNTMYRGQQNGGGQVSVRACWQRGCSVLASVG